MQASIAARNQLTELERLHEFLTEFGGALGWPADTLADVELALEEVFVNVVRYGFPQGGEHEIAIAVTHEQGAITLTVEDGGVAFNPLEAPLPNLDLPLEERGVGGLGLHLVKGVMDEIEYARVDGRNRLTVRKKAAQ